MKQHITVSQMKSLSQNKLLEILNDEESKELLQTIRDTYDEFLVSHYLKKLSSMVTIGMLIEFVMPFKIDIFDNGAWLVHIRTKTEYTRFCEVELVDALWEATKHIIESKSHVDCNECCYINVTEEQQSKNKEPHVCMSFEESLLHRCSTKNHDSRIYPCDKCGGKEFRRKPNAENEN